MRNDFQNLVLDELLHIANGESRVTEQMIEAEKDDRYKEVLVALLELSEDIKFKKKESELIIEELNKQKRKAEMATKAKAEFLSMISHEIRTPLNAIIGIGHILTHESPRSDQMTYIQNLRWSGDNLLAIINDVLDFNKIEAGKVNFESTPFNIRNSISGVLESMRMKANEQNCKLIKSIEDNLPDFLVGDPTRFIQILNNLVSNAVKFTMNGTVRLDAQYRSIDETMIELEVNVSDSGIGISEDKLKQIFEHFSQADSKINRKFGGTGLGLTITKQLIELQGGQISVNSELGIGSSFKIVLPFKLPNELEIRERQGTSTNYLDLSLKGARVLIVEDIAVNRLVVEKFLTEWEVITDFAENGMEAIDRVISGKFDLVLMDLQMPVMDGFIATSEIRKLPRNKYRHLPIVALTAASISEVSSEVYDAGMNDIVSKPINPAELYKTIAKYVKPASENGSKQKIINQASDLIFEHQNSDLKFTYIKNLAKGDQYFFKKVLKLSIKAFEEFISEYSSGLLTDDFEKLSNTRHKIYSSINNFEIKELMHLMKESKQSFVKNNKNYHSDEYKIEHLKNVEKTTNKIIKKLQLEILRNDLIEA
ncbi:MAG: ATP-binding protein [Reichenbachiella sp.]|uniref:ATP-binding protein n=1 Tax=Reichenbachiella sp. TaxID=2184521 RepID=UPI0029673F89|nr:ATP-binding protein [Reichenbachiella sp.]MDW3210779.1 ATP-binding protein [Reichenbachiella sp.]